MALVTIPPTQLFAIPVAPDRFTMQANAASEGAAWIFQAPVTDTLTHLVFATGTVTTGSTLDGRIETVGTTGNPSGTLYNASGTGTLAIVATTDNNKILELPINGGSGVAITRGDYIACTVRQPSSAAGDAEIAFCALSSGYYQTDRPTCSRERSSGWEDVIAITQPAFGIRCTTNGLTHIPGMIGPTTSVPGISGWTSSSNPDEYGNSFVAPAKMRICGAEYKHTIAGNTGDFRVNLRSDSGTLLANTADLEGDRASNGYRRVLFPTPYELVAGTRYDLTLEARTATATGGLWNNVSSGYLALFSGGSSTYQVSYNNGASRTTSTDRVTSIVPLVDQIDDGAGAPATSVFVSRPSTLLRR